MPSEQQAYESCHRLGEEARPDGEGLVGDLSELPYSGLLPIMPFERRAIVARRRLEEGSRQDRGEKH